MTLSVTFALLVGFVVFGVFCGWRGSRPSNPARGVRLIPWRPLMVGCALGTMLMLVHLAELTGIRTGR